MIALITGAGGLIGSEACRFFAAKGYHIVGIDNDSRANYFGKDASTSLNLLRLSDQIDDINLHWTDIRDNDRLQAIFNQYGSDIAVVIHTAAQPSHDWAARNPRIDFEVNAVGTLNLLEATRQHCPNAAFIFTSSSKVYGEHPNELPMVEKATRWEIASDHRYHDHGIDESMSIDQTLHSIFGSSKVAADIMVQEYGKYYGLNTGVFRGGCLTGPGHSPVALHGFLAYLVKCATTNTPYTMIGYKGKQVRDNIHSADLVDMFWHFSQDPRPGEVYNAGGGRFSNCSILEAIAICEELTGQTMSIQYDDQPRKGDHIWYISDSRKFQLHYPNWSQTYDLRMILQEMTTAAGKISRVSSD